jgi:ATP-dependent DNA helicase RecQ
MELSIKEEVPAYVIFSDATLLELATYLPLSLDDMQRISGFGEVKTARYGETFLACVAKYCHEHKLDSKISEKVSSGRKRVRDIKPVINETKSETLRMFREGKKAAEIATLRDLTTSTIENHLASFLVLGEVKITDLVPQNKIEIIQKALGKNGYLPLKYLKDNLGDDYTYGEIRAVIEAAKQGIL